MVASAMRLAYAETMNPRLIMLGLGLAVGYVLGTRDGRERYDWMKSKVTGVWEDPRVAKARHDLEVYARQQAPIIRERAEAAAKAAPGFIADTAKDVANRTAETAKDVAGKVSATAKDVAEKATSAAAEVKAQAAKVAADVRSRGEAAVDAAVTRVGTARDAALQSPDDEDAPA